MKIPARTGDRGFAFNITPLIDVVFLLIIFFLVASHFIRNESVERVELPLASQGQNDEDSPSRLVITVMPDGELMHGTTTIDQAEFESMLRFLVLKHKAENTEVRIRADRNVEFSKVQPLLLAAARQGVVRVRFSVLKP